MNIHKQILFIFTGLVLFSSASANNPVAVANASANSIEWQPNVSSAIVLEVTNGFQFTYRNVFKNSNPTFSTTQDGKPLVDGQYTYQLTGSATADGMRAMVRQSGTFEMADGNLTLSSEDNDTE